MWLAWFGRVDKSVSSANGSTIRAKKADANSTRIKSDSQWRWDLKISTNTVEFGIFCQNFRQL